MFLSNLNQNKTGIKILLSLKWNLRKIFFLKKTLYIGLKNVNEQKDMPIINLYS